MDCYTERSYLLALLAAEHPALLYIDPEGEEGFVHVLAIEVGGRWLTWHIADDDMALFSRIPLSSESVWDGHTTEEKYKYIWDALGLR